LFADLWEMMMEYALAGAQASAMGLFANLREIIMEHASRRTRPQEQTPSKIPVQLEQAMYGFLASQILFAGDKLGIFTLLGNSGPVKADQVSSELGTHPATTLRFLQAACSLGVIRQSESGFELPEQLTPFLDRTHPGYFGAMLGHFSNRTWTASTSLAETIRTGEAPWKAGAHRSPFPEMYGNAKDTRAFLDAMWNLGILPSRELAAKFPFTDFRHLVDVGGATGSFATAVLQAHPHLHATIFDLPPVRPHMERQCVASGLTDRLKFAEGSFFDDVLPQGDVYSLGYILSDWDDDTGNALLQKIYQRLPLGGALGGAVLILEKLFDDNKCGPLATAMMDVAMLLETDGRHRSAAEYIAWLERTGFTNCVVLRSSGEKHMVAGYKQATSTL
jgi:hypothetical protein